MMYYPQFKDNHTHLLQDWTCNREVWCANKL